MHHTAMTACQHGAVQ